MSKLRQYIHTVFLNSSGLWAVVSLTHSELVAITVFPDKQYIKKAGIFKNDLKKTDERTEILFLETLWKKLSHIVSASKMSA